MTLLLSASWFAKYGDIRVQVRPAHETVTDTEWAYTRYCIDTIDSPDDEHEVARNM